MFDDWPWWATLAVAIGCGYIGFWGLRPKNPDRGKTYWEKRLPELQEIAEHLRAVRMRETLIHPKYETPLRHFADTLDNLGVPRPPDGVLRDDLRDEWEVYLWLFIDKVKRGQAANLRPVYQEARELHEHQKYWSDGANLLRHYHEQQRRKLSDPE